jgi:hypothetical protein
MSVLAAFVCLRADMLTLFFNQKTTDNLFQTAFSESDHVSSMGFSLDKDLGGISLFAEGSLSYLYENPDLTFYTQDLGLDHVWVVGKKSGLYVSLTGRGAFYRSDFSDFNYGALNAYGAFKSYLSPTSILKADYALILRDYRWSQFDYVSQAVNVTLDKFFQSRTTLKAGLGWGFKHYFHPYSEEAAPPADENIIQDMNQGKDLVQVLGNGSGPELDQRNGPGMDQGTGPGSDQGTGPGKDQGTDPGSGPGSDQGTGSGSGSDMNQGQGPSSGPGMDRGMGAGRPVGSDSLVFSLPQAGGQQGSQGMHTLALSTLIAQGIGDRMGVRITGVKQWPLSGENPFMYVWEFYMVENPFYDRFSWAGHELGAQVTYLLPGDIQAQLGYGFSQKEFPGVEVLGEDGNATGMGREDSRHHWQVRFSKDFFRFSLMLTYNFINNGSNDPLFDWQGNFLALGVEWNVFFGERQ